MAEQVLEASQPAALEASLAAAAEVEERRRQVIRHWEQRIERARYEADRAARQYHACEPENRLVARTLERRRDEAPASGPAAGGGVRPVHPDATAAPGRSRPGADPPAGRGSAGAVAGPDDDAGGPAAGRPAADRPGGADGRPGGRPRRRAVEWAGGAVRERTIRRDVQGYKHQQAWPSCRPRLAELHGRGETPKAIAAALEATGSGRRSGPPGSRPGWCGGCCTIWVRPRVPRCAAGPGLVAGREAGCTTWPGSWAYRRTRCTGGGRRAGCTPARSAAGAARGRCGRTGELDRLRALKECPRVWTHRERLAELRVPGPRRG